MASLLLGSETKPTHNFPLGAKKQFAFLLTKTAVGKAAGGVTRFWTGSSGSTPTSWKFGLYESNSNKKPEGKPLYTAETGKLGSNEEVALTWNVEPQVGGKFVWLVVLCVVGNGSCLSAETGAACCKGSVVTEALVEESAANWKEEGSGPVGFFMTGTASASASPELKLGVKLAVNVKVNKVPVELPLGTSLVGEAFSGGVPLYYGPAGEEAAEKKEWEKQELEPGNINTTGVRYVRAWKGAPLTVANEGTVKTEQMPRRTVIFIHGGGDVNNQWRTLEGIGAGSGEYVQSFAPKGAKTGGKKGHGLCVFNLNYRDEPALGAGGGQRQLEDVVEGIKFCISKASEYNGDPGKVYLLGGSAGVGLALRASQVLNTEVPNTIAGVCGFSPYGFDFQLVAEEMESGTYREYPRLVGALKEKTTKILELAGHNLLTGSQILFPTVPGEANVLKPNVNYYVKRLSASEIELEAKENGGTLTWTAFGASTLTAYEKHPGGNVENLVKNLQVALDQELNYTGSGFTPAWSPPIVGEPEKTNTAASRTVQKSLSPRYQSSPGQCRFCFITCEKDLVEQGWVTPTVTKLEGEGHPTLSYIAKEGPAAEGHSFATLWGASKIKPGSPGMLGQEVLFNWIEENIYAVPLNVGTKVNVTASRSFTTQVKTGTSVASPVSRSRTVSIATGAALSTVASRSFNTTVQTGAKIAATASRSRAVSLSTGSSLAAPISRTFNSTLRAGTLVKPRLSNNFRPILTVGTSIAGTTSRTFPCSLQAGTRVASPVSRGRTVALSTGVALTAGASRTANVQIRLGTNLTSQASRSRTVSLATGTNVAVSSSRTFAARLPVGTRLASSVTSKACRVSLSVGTILYGGASRTTRAQLSVGTTVQTSFPLRPVDITLQFPKLIDIQVTSPKLTTITIQEV